MKNYGIEIFGNILQQVDKDLYLINFYFLKVLNTYFSEIVIVGDRLENGGKFHH